MTRRVVVTGLGVIAPNGNGLGEFELALRKGRSGIRAIDKLAELGFGCRVAAPASGVTIDDVPQMDGDDIWDPDYRADPKRYSRAYEPAPRQPRESIR